jgi:hypothetical protein
MADCEYCGKPAGMFRSIHKECAKRRDQARSDIDTAFRNLMIVDRPPAPASFRAIVEKLGDDARLDNGALRAKIISGLGIAVDTALGNIDLSHGEMERLQGIVEAFDLGDRAFDEAGKREQLVKALVLKDLLEGRASTRLRVMDPLPIALKHGETLQWLFQGVALNEPKALTSYIGGSHGVSVRLAKGLSYRVGAYKGQRVEHTKIVRVGTGNLCVTTRAVYFLSGANSKKTPLSGLVSVNAYDDGIIVTPSRGKPQIFLMSDPMFAANLILKVAAL